MFFTLITFLFFVAPVQAHDNNFEHGQLISEITNRTTFIVKYACNAESNESLDFYQRNVQKRFVRLNKHLQQRHDGHPDIVESELGNHWENFINNINFFYTQCLTQEFRF